ncbi:Mov34/MPN/PAD-1 family protein [Sphingobium subterraneum]|uniref:Proteasome lid subunit RPN8/RPN11 n=1 Tax=Sphingobium subterraneum TaxID=627688 RepID=A0A841IVX6_9SPHN|nr:M67 family metallopeptidase [Sphingobium subterraneum]MBB6122322.1 proteasome lid subunit RPN8/RPN11 [Sphingobium subterraneum]
MVTRISRVVLDDILGRARDNPNVEVCGLLLGQDGRITHAVAAANVAEDPTCRFEIEPATLLAAHRAARAGGPTIVGHYHSHPSGDLVPSSCDADAAHADGSLWLIVSGRDCALWCTGETGLHGRFSRENWEYDDSIADAALASSRPERQ